MAADDVKQWKTAGDRGRAVLHSDTWGKFQKRPDGTTQYHPS